MLVDKAFELKKQEYKLIKCNSPIFFVS